LSGKDAWVAASADTGFGAIDIASPQLVRKKSGRDHGQPSAAINDKSAFPQVKVTFPATTDDAQ